MALHFQASWRQCEYIYFPMGIYHIFLLQRPPSGCTEKQCSTTNARCSGTMMMHACMHAGQTQLHGGPSANFQAASRHSRRWRCRSRCTAQSAQHGSCVMRWTRHWMCRVPRTSHHTLRAAERSSWSSPTNPRFETSSSRLSFLTVSE